MLYIYSSLYIPLKAAAPVSWCGYQANSPLSLPVDCRGGNKPTREQLGISRQGFGLTVILFRFLAK